MKNLRLKALVLFVTAGLTSCTSDDETTTIITKKSLVTEVSGAQTAKLNEEIVLEITYSVENNCLVFNKFIENATEKTTTIEVQTRLEGTSCDDNPVTKKTNYKFKAATEGTYILKFKKSDTEFITQTITVSTAS